MTSDEKSYKKNIYTAAGAFWQNKCSKNDEHMRNMKNKNQ